MQRLDLLTRAAGDWERADKLVADTAALQPPLVTYVTSSPEETLAKVKAWMAKHAMHVE